MSSVGKCPRVDFLGTAQERERKLRSLLFTASIKRGIRHFYLVQWGQEMYKKVWCTCKVVFLLNKTIAFLTFSLPSWSSLLKLSTFWAEEGVCSQASTRRNPQLLRHLDGASRKVRLWENGQEKQVSQQTTSKINDRVIATYFSYISRLSQMRQSVFSFGTIQKLVTNFFF